MPRLKDKDYLRDTDYTVEDIRLLLTSGAIPKEMLTFCEDGNTLISGVVPEFFKRFPKSKFDDDWLQQAGDWLHGYAAWCQRERRSIEPKPTPPKHGESVVLYYLDTKDLSDLTNMKEAKLNKLLHWVKRKYPGQASAFILSDPQEGYMVRQDFVVEFQKRGRRFDKFLKDIVTGRAILVEVKAEPGRDYTTIDLPTMTWDESGGPEGLDVSPITHARDFCEQGTTPP